MDTTPKHITLYFTFFLFFVITFATPHCNSNDKKTLLRIKQIFNTTDAFQNWDPDTNCCDGTWNYIDCDSHGRIKTFNFDGNSVVGTYYHPGIFPDEIGNLPYLTTLAFRNAATGPIPAFLTKLRHLRDLTLSDNRLSGPIPRFITRFKKLQALALDNNQLTGSIPSQLARLRHLYYIDLSINKLTGRIPGSLFSKLKHPNQQDGIHLLLRENRLHGEIPRSFANVKFTELHLQYNRLTGDTSFLLGKNDWLSILYLSGNRLSFDMSDMKVATNSSVLILSLDHNRIFGKLPESLVNLTNLDQFDVSNNLLCGKIPVGGRLQNFDASSYSNNTCLCGTPLPHCV